MLVTRDVLRRSFSTIVSASAAPYGYTLTVWSSGALLIHFRHAPRIWEIFLFVGGALAAFATLWLAGRDTIERSRTLDETGARALTGVLDIFAVGVAVGTAALLAMIPDWVAWPLVAFGATLVYMVAASVQLALAETSERG
jgi:hypothetical protein